MEGLLCSTIEREAIYSTCVVFVVDATRVCCLCETVLHLTLGVLAGRNRLGLLDSNNPFTGHAADTAHTELTTMHQCRNLELVAIRA